MIRFILAALTVILFLIINIPTLLILWIIGKWKPEWKSRFSLFWVRGVFRVILWEAGVKATVIGLENVPEDQPVLFIGNHRSYFDILLNYVRVKGQTGFIAKKEMEKIPLLSNWMRNLHCLFLDRVNIKEGLKTILTAIEQVKNGISIFIFPEGTRNRSEDPADLMEFHEGSFKIATKSKCLIVPVAMNNTSEIFESHLPKIKATHVVIEYCKPIDLSTLSKEEQKHIGKYTQQVIQDTLKKNQDLV